MDRQPLTYLERADLIPPFMCLLLARMRGRKPILIEDIARRAGMNAAYVGVIIYRKSWRRIPIETVDRLRAACGITPANEWHHLKYLCRTFDWTRTSHPLAHDYLRPFNSKKKMNAVLKRADIGELIRRWNEAKPRKPAAGGTGSPVTVGASVASVASEVEPALVP